MKIKECDIPTGMCLPPFGIYVNRNAPEHVRQHEYGHYLQYKEYGMAKYYLTVGLPSVISAATSAPGEHMKKNFERDASRRAVEHFGADSEIAKHPERYPV
ncbi:hypothetical protein KKE60_08175 [Patescibacteria group bacterium]|nr:hypothetical protein [Patescibacteria group bacterium]